MNLVQDRKVLGFSIDPQDYLVLVYTHKTTSYLIVVGRTDTYSVFAGKTFAIEQKRDADQEENGSAFL